MNRSRIRRAYDSIAPDKAAKARMLDGILSAASKEQPTRKDTNVRIIKLRHTLCIAAAVALFVALSVTAYANGWFGLGDMSIGRLPVGPEGEQQLAEIISLQGAADSPEFLAVCEWEDFLSGYDTDGSILASIGNKPTEFDEKYRFYTCYTQEMADKIEEIREKYSLSLVTDMKVFDGDDGFFKAAGTGKVFTRAGEGYMNTVYSSYVYNDGSFHFEGEAQFTDDNASWPYPISYQVERSMKGTFLTTTLNIGDADDYEEWTYTTKNGVELTLAQSDWTELILVEREDSFVVVNLYDVYVGDVVKGELHKSHEDLEAFADLFDFSVIP